MALIECTECRTQISSEAQACPACGQPLQLKKEKSGCGIFAVLLPILFAVVLMAELFGRTENSKSTQYGEMPKIGDVWFVGPGALGCTDQAYLERMAKLSTQGDRDAIATALFRTISSHACRALNLNSTLYVEEIEPSGFVCGRPRGEPVCVWVHKNAVSPWMFPAADKAR